MLIVLGGLPGTGKTTIGKALAAKHNAAYLRIDVIEHVLRSHMPPGQTLGPEGYAIAQAIALSNLQLGLWVVADCVNPVPESRSAWRQIAAEASTAMIEIELICSDANEHRRRVESRTPDIDGFELPTWANVLNHRYSPWTERRLLLDTALLNPADTMLAIEDHIRGVQAV
jgi:predicted kinase